MSLNVTVSGLALAKAVREQSLAGKALAPLVEKCTVETRRVANERTQRRTGQMEQGYRSEYIAGGGGPVIGRIRTSNPVLHAYLHEEGVAHTWRIPRAGDTVLAFEGRGGVRIVMFGHVTHPGLKARHIIRDALRAIANRSAA